MSIGQKLHPDRVSLDRLRELWNAVYEGYTEPWDDNALQDMAAVGEDVCAALEELYELKGGLPREGER